MQSAGKTCNSGQSEFARTVRQLPKEGIQYSELADH